MRLFLAFLVVLCFTGQAIAQDCTGEECEAQFQTLEQLQAAQEKDTASLQKLLMKYQRMMEADKSVVFLKKRMNIRAGAIQREEQLKEAGLVKKGKKPKAKKK